MKMNAQTIGWLIFLILIKNFSCKTFFSLEDRHLTAKEGSCAEIKCRVTSTVDVGDAHWFWMKDAQWIEKEGHFDGTIINSSDLLKHPVNPVFATRVKYIGSPSTNWNYETSSQKLCSILICNLNKTDSGEYSFRFLGKLALKWMTKPGVNLTVTDNPCPITFKEPPAVKESDPLTLTCATLSSCPSNLKIESVMQPSRVLGSKHLQRDEKEKNTTVSFTASWEDDGKTFSCQTEDNNDACLIQKINVTVEYAPKETLSTISHTTIRERQSVTLTCSAKGRPEPTFSWKNDTHITVSSKAEWKIESIQASQSGRYYCEAHNKHGTTQSKPEDIDVTYAPEVEVEVTSPASQVKQGDTVTLTCTVKRSKPQPDTFSWFKDGKDIRWQTNQYVRNIEPEDSGSYTCQATNTAGTGTSKPLYIEVQYRPRKTKITSDKFNNEVNLGQYITFTCETDANPSSEMYSWYRYTINKQTDSSQQKSYITNNSKLGIESVQRTDEACYTCNATNRIDTGESSDPVCIQVLYRPTNLLLLMDSEVIEGQILTVTCTVESFPSSHLKLIKSRSSHTSYEEDFTLPDMDQRPNALRYEFNVSSTHTGAYSCDARNREGSSRSPPRDLVVKYRPKDVTVIARPNLIVIENASLRLSCNAQAYPEASYSWMKMIDGKSKILERTQVISRISVSPSDSGLYVCAAGNEIGTEMSKQAEVKVKYAPKHTTVTMTEVLRQPNGTGSVTLSCSSHSFPQVDYSWYKKTKGKDIKVSGHQNYTVYSNQPGVYFCIAKNYLNQRSSDPISLFEDGGVIKALMFFFLLLLIILILLFLFFVFRHKRNKTIQQGTTSIPHFDFQGLWTGSRRPNLMNESVLAEPSRSRDDLLPADQRRPKAQQRRPRPDNTPASNIHTVYSTVNVPAGKQGPAARNPIRQQRGHSGDESLNYASIDFGNKQKNQKEKAEENIVYAAISKRKPHKNEQERQEDYENFSSAHAASEEEVELDYSKVNFKAKLQHQSDSSSTSEDETQYSEVNV